MALHVAADGEGASHQFLLVNTVTHVCLVVEQLATESLGTKQLVAIAVHDIASFVHRTAHCLRGTCIHIPLQALASIVVNLQPGIKSRQLLTCGRHAQDAADAEIRFE